jgi:hypothetical protein
LEVFGIRGLPPNNFGQTIQATVKLPYRSKRANIFSCGHAAEKVVDALPSNG